MLYGVLFCCVGLAFVFFGMCLRDLSVVCYVMLYDLVSSFVCFSVFVVCVFKGDCLFCL